jgi:phosphate transport system substrate-binding protein
MTTIRRPSEISACLGYAAILVCTIVTAAPAQTLSIHGSMTFNSRIMEPHQAEIEALAKRKLVVVANKSSLGLLALLEKRADLAMISASLDGEVATLRKERPDLPFERLRSFEISQTRVAFAVHPTNPIRSITRERMRGVLLGDMVNWRDLGGADLPIRIVMVRDGGGVQASVETELLNNKRIASKDPIRVHISSQVIKMVEQEPGGLGLAQLGTLRQSKVPELVLDRPIVQFLNLVTLDEPDVATKAVIESIRRVATAKLAD